MMKEKKLTTEQLDALNLNIHIALNANAGSGKTSVLVERFYSILEKSINGEIEVSPDEIVAITFTRKASAEMLSRVIKRFNSSFQTENINLDNKKIKDLNYLEKLRTTRNKLTNARISTIHSFCLQILTNYPVEANLPAYFGEISESERLKLFEDAFNSVLMNWIGTNEKKSILSKIFSSISLEDLRDLSQNVISNIDLWNDLQKIYNKSFEEYLIDLGKFFYNTYHNCILSLFEFLNDLSEKNTENQKLVGIAKEISSFISFTKKLFAEDKSKPLLDSNFWDKLSNLFEKFYTKEKKLRKKVFKTDDDFEDIEKLNEKFQKTIKFLDKILEYNSFKKRIGEKFSTLDIEHRYFETSKIIFDFINDVYDNFQKFKFDKGLIDYSDMLLKTYQLFKQYPNILDEVRKGIKFLMVDEFQDTDKLQFEIIKQLVPKNGNQTNNIPNLFIVGDEKQSIYSFRNADVRIFKNAKSYIKELNDANEDSYYYNNGLLKLTLTFRLKPEIAAFVDNAFESIMNVTDEKPYSDFNIDYEPFVIPVSKIQQYANRNFAIPPITFLFENKSQNTFISDNKDDNYKETENQNKNDVTNEDTDTNKLEIIISKHIHFIVQNDDVLIYDKDNDIFRKIEYSDIAILSRKIKDLTKVATVLSSQNIPFIFQGVKNFYTVNEIQDIVSFLKFLVNPKNDVSLVAVLRSAFFEFTDEELLNISSSSEENLPFWDKIQKYYDFLNSNSDVASQNEYFSVSFKKIENAIQTLKKLQQLVSILPINELIHRILVETNWHKKVRCFKNFDQILANVDEFLQYSREYVEIGFRTILDFIQDIDYISKYGISDVDRFGFVSSNAVRLITFHSAKGLEFPVVYLYKIDAKLRETKYIDVSREIGLIFPMEIYLENEVQKAPTLQNIIASEQLQIEQDAEESRILYVATTRASDFLIITGNIYFDTKTSEPKFKYHLKSLLDALSINIKQEQFNSLTLNLQLKILRENKKIEKINIDVPIEYFLNNFDRQKSSVATEDTNLSSLPCPKSLLEKIQPEISKNIFSSTKFNIYSLNSKNYVKSYFLGLHRSPKEIFHSSLEEDFETKDNIIVSSIIGNTIHYCLENIWSWFNPNGFLIGKLIETIENSMFLQERNLSREIQNIILEQCLNIVQTKLIKRYKDLVINSPKEYEILLPIDNNFLFAKIDLLLQNQNSEFEIWDWKSNNLKSCSEIPEYANTYRLQMETYALAVSYLHPKQETIKAKLLFTKLARPEAEDSEWTFDFIWTKNELFEIESKLKSQMLQMNQLII